MAVNVITKENFSAIIATGTTLIDFWAPWCGPCRAIGPVVEEIADENPDVKVGKVNVDEQPEHAAQFGVMRIPTLISFKDGEKHKTMGGVHSKSDLLELIK